MPRNRIFCQSSSFPRQDFPKLSRINCDSRPFNVVSVSIAVFSKSSIRNTLTLSLLLGLKQGNPFHEYQLLFGRFQSAHSL